MNNPDTTTATTHTPVQSTISPWPKQWCSRPAVRPSMHKHDHDHIHHTEHDLQNFKIPFRRSLTVTPFLMVVSNRTAFTPLTKTDCGLTRCHMRQDHGNSYGGSNAQSVPVVLTTTNFGHSASVTNLHHRHEDLADTSANPLLFVYFLSGHPQLVSYAHPAVCLQYCHSCWMAAEVNRIAIICVSGNLSCGQ